MSEEKRYLAFDLGAESGRAIAATLKDGRMELDVLHRFPNGPIRVGNTLHWDVIGIFRELKTGLSAYAAKYGNEVSGIATDSWGVDYALLDENDAMIGNPVHYRDARTDGMAEDLFKTVPRKEVFNQTGIQILPFNTIYQLYSMVKHNSPHLPLAKSMLCMADLQNFFFTGEKAVEFSMATTTQMYNPLTSDWATGMLEQVGIPTSILPQVVAPGSIIGELYDHIAIECGVKRAPVIATATHDTAAAVAAVPAKGEDWLYLSSGTWSLLGAEITEPIIDDRSFGVNFTNEGGVDGTYRFLKNIMGLWLVQECRRTWLRAGEDLDYATITRLATEATPFKAAVDPNDPSFIAPGDMPPRIADYCKKTGQTPPESKGEFIRTALESLAMAYRHTIEMISEITGKTYNVLHIVGGGTQNKLLNQFTADATGLTVKTGPIEATAFGNCLMQAIALGDIGSLQEAREIVSASVEIETFEPSADRSAWEDAYGRYCSMVR